MMSYIRRGLLGAILALAMVPASASASVCDSGPLAYAPECDIYSDMGPTEIQFLQSEADALSALPFETSTDALAEVAASPVATGIFNIPDEIGRPPIPSDMFAPSNAWTGIQGLNVVSVWAGSSPYEGDLGMAVVATYDATGSFLENVVAVTAPTATGPLRIITSSLGNGVVLVNDVNNSFFFDFLQKKILPQ